ncbi:YkgJ family cysteine cluster protein [Halovenus salina]|uniref:YkgJ family cysteine cluster protein n=1 Tax=Halovenus salina TaxID=1510225 RepID=UPI002260A054|nr:YkgJ family cysteine cluster protein [Halovenus salina]
MESLETELDRARSLSVEHLADAIESIGFECTHCGACCKAADCGDTASDEEHTATAFPDEVRELQEQDEYDWRDVARPMPYGLTEDGGETFEWALQTDGCGDCTFYDDAAARCTVHEDRPLICQTYPFSVALGGTSQPLGEAVDSEGMVRAHECEGLGRDISRADAEELAAALKERAVRELEEAIGVRDNYEPVETDGVVVYDSEGPKDADGQPY